MMISLGDIPIDLMRWILSELDVIDIASFRLACRETRDIARELTVIVSRTKIVSPKFLLCFPNLKHVEGMWITMNNHQLSHHNLSIERRTNYIPNVDGILYIKRILLARGKEVLLFDDLPMQVLPQKYEVIHRLYGNNLVSYRRIGSKKIPIGYSGDVLDFPNYITEDEYYSLRWLFLVGDQMPKNMEPFPRLQELGIYFHMWAPSPNYLIGGEVELMKNTANEAKRFLINDYHHQHHPIFIGTRRDPKNMYGPQGPQGLEGLEGSIWFTGPTGTIGPTGTMGTIGPTGVINNYFTDCSRNKLEKLASNYPTVSVYSSHIGSPILKKRKILEILGNPS